MRRNGKNVPKYRRITAMRALARLEELCSEVTEQQGSKMLIPRSLVENLKDDFRQHVTSYLSKGKR